jgi:hypothetical protein
MHTNSGLSEMQGLAAKLFVDILNNELQAGVFTGGLRNCSLQAI